MASFDYWFRRIRCRVQLRRNVQIRIEGWDVDVEDAVRWCLYLAGEGSKLGRNPVLVTFSGRIPRCEVAPPKAKHFMATLKCDHLSVDIHEVVCRGDAVENLLAVIVPPSPIALNAERGKVLFGKFPPTC